MIGLLDSRFLAKCRGSFSLAPSSLKKIMLSCSIEISNKQQCVFICAVVSIVF